MDILKTPVPAGLKRGPKAGLKCFQRELSQVHRESSHSDEVSKGTIDMIKGSGLGLWNRTMGLRGGSPDDASNGDGKSNDGREGEVEEPVQTSKKYYSEHRFQVDLGFKSAKDMFQMLVNETRVDPDMPRHLVIRDVGEVAFSKHPRRMLAVVLAKFLGVATEDKEMLPIVGVWTDDTETVVNVETKCDNHSTQLLGADKIFGVDVKIVPHKFRNTSRVTVWDSDGVFAPFNDEELKDLLEGQAVVGVTRETYKNKSTGEKVKGKRYRITFDKRVPPKYIQFPSMGIQLKCELFVPLPARCFYCQQIGHYEDQCKNKPKGKVCHRCASRHVQVEGVACSLPVKCVNCQGDHPASYRGCPAFRQEQGIKRKAVEDRMSPRMVMDQWKKEGSYIDYTKATAADRVRKEMPIVSADKVKDRLDSVERSINDVKSMILGMVNPQPDTYRREEEAMNTGESNVEEIRGLQEENVRLRNENLQLKGQLQEFSVMKDEFAQMKEQMKQLREGSLKPQNVQDKENEILKHLQAQVSKMVQERSEFEQRKREVENRVRLKDDDFQKQLSDLKAELVSQKAKSAEVAGKKDLEIKRLKSLLNEGGSRGRSDNKSATHRERSPFVSNKGESSSQHHG